MKNRLFLLLCLLAISSPIQSQTAAEPGCPGCPDWLNFDASSLEDALARPAEIRSLDLAMQKLTSIGSRIGELENLTCLDLSFNRFGSLPPEFANLKNLTCLRLTGCRFLAGVPKVLAELPNLTYLDLRDHPEWTEKQFHEAAALLPRCTIVK